MTNLKQRETKIIEKKKQSKFRDFVKENMSLRPLTFYKNSGLTSRYPINDRIKGVISQREFEENRDNLTKRGLDYNFSINLFRNYQNLLNTIDLPQTVNWGQNENSEFADQILNTRNSYLSYVVIRDCENVLYSFSVKEKSRNVLNSLHVWNNSENVFSSKGVIQGFNIFYSKFILNSSNVWFSSNLVGCQECMFCDGLENKSYCYKNQQYSKEEYNKLKVDSLKEKEKFHEWFLGVTNVGANFASENVNGVFNRRCNNIKNGYFNYQTTNSQNIILVGGNGDCENIYDVFGATPPLENVYGSFSSGMVNDLYNSMHVAGGSNIYYSWQMEDCNHCISCIGLKNKEYCILNKEYDKETRYRLVNQIFQSMEWDGILGDFFPGWLNPFYFNDTIAYLFDDSFTKEEVEEEGYLWREEQIKVDIPQGAKIERVAELGKYEGFDKAGNRNIKDSILKKVIKDQNGDCYRIVKMEHEFLLKHGLPLPRLHWIDRMKINFNLN